MVCKLRSVYFCHSLRQIDTDQMLSPLAQNISLVCVVVVGRKWWVYSVEQWHRWIVWLVGLARVQLTVPLGINEAFHVYTDRWIQAYPSRPVLNRHFCRASLPWFRDTLFLDVLDIEQAWQPRMLMQLMMYRWPRKFYTQKNLETKSFKISKKNVFMENFEIRIFRIFHGRRLKIVLFSVSCENTSKNRVLKLE